MGRAADPRRALSIGLQWSTNIVAMSLGLVIPALVGNWLDGRWGTSPAGVILGTVLGSVLSFWQLMRLTRVWPDKPHERQSSDES